MSKNPTHLYVIAVSGTFINLEAIDFIAPHQVLGYIIHYRGGEKQHIMPEDFEALKQYLIVVNE